MSKSTITIDPVTRIEGHLAVRVEQENGLTTQARCSGTLFRGLEIILRGRDPRDAPIYTQRICGVCPQAHATASARALDEAFGLKDRIPPNGLLLRDIMLGSNFMQSHILHFYHLAALDYVDVTAVKDYAGSDSDLLSVKDFIGRGSLAPFVPRYEGDYRLSADENRAAVKHYVEALEVRKNAHELVAIFGGKMPHQCTVVVGGVATQVTADKVIAALSYVRRIEEFIDRCYIPDILLLTKRYADYLDIGAGCGRFLSCGGFAGAGAALFDSGVVEVGRQVEQFVPDKIAEKVKSSYYADACAADTPFESRTEPDRGKQGAYSWLKSPRYEGRVCEVGPLARTMVSYGKGNARTKAAVDGLLRAAGVGVGKLNSTLGRHAARALEAKLVAQALQEWLLALRPGEPCNIRVEVPKQGRGMGLTEAPRGALGHWVVIEGGKIANYQAVVPTTWNGSPRDADGAPGPIEQAIENVKLNDVDNPYELVRIIRSFDPCLACAVHVMHPKGCVRVEMPVV